MRDANDRVETPAKASEHERRSHDGKRCLHGHVCDSECVVTAQRDHCQSVWDTVTVMQSRARKVARSETVLKVRQEIDTPLSACGQHQLAMLG